MNIEECYKRVTCQEVHEQLPKIVRDEELAPSEGGENRLYLLEGHIESCDRCLSAYSDAMDELARQSPMSGFVPPVPMLPKALSLSFLQAAEEAEATTPGTLSPIIRARVEQLLEHEDVAVRNAAKRLVNVWAGVPLPTKGRSVPSAQAQGLLNLKLKFLQLLQGGQLDSALSTLGEGPAQAQQTVHAVDHNGRKIALTILSGPVVTHDGHFRFRVHGSEDHLIGMQLECGIEINDEKPLTVVTTIHAASGGQGWEASFDTVFLPDPALRLPDCDIPIDDLTIQVRPAIT